MSHLNVKRDALKDLKDMLTFDTQGTPEHKNKMKDRSRYSFMEPIERQHTNYTSTMNVDKF